MSGEKGGAWSGRWWEGCGSICVPVAMGEEGCRAVYGQQSCSIGFFFDIFLLICNFYFS